MTQSSSAPRGPGVRSPRAIAHYAIRGRLGKGAMGIVYDAVDERSGEPVALKVIASDLEGDDEVRARFFREVVVAGQLRHRNIVAVLDSGEDAGRLYLAMELLSGMTLGEFLKEPDAADLEMRVDLMIQICQGLMVAHEAGVYHRDIKPGNLFVSADRRVKILDFGVARLAGSNMTVTGYVLGTPDFMSPEQARGQDVDERSDIFSAGAVFYLMLTGRKPFAADDLPAVLTKVLRENPPPIRPDEAPVPLATVIHKALSKNPAGRQQTMAQLAAELMRAADAIVATTCQRALGLRPHAEQLVRLEEHANGRRRELDLPVAARGEWQELTDRYPMLRRGPGVLGAFPLRSSIVEAVSVELAGRLVTLRKEIDVLDQAHAEWSRGCTLLAAGNDAEAMEHLAAARRLVPESPAIASKVQACTEASATRRDRQARFANRLQAAEEAAARSDWDAVLAIVAEIDDVISGSPEAQRLRQVARHNLDLLRQRRAREQASHQVASVLAEARELAGDERFEDAIARLEAYLLAHPDAPGVSEAVQAIRREYDASRSRKQRLAETARLAEESRRAFDAGDFDTAERAAARAVALNGEDTELARHLARVRAAIVERNEREARLRRVGDLIERATRLAERQKFAPALGVLDEALAIQADHQQAAALRARIAAAFAEQERMAQAEALKARQQRAAGPAIREARRALASGDVRRARSAADVALAQGPNLPEVLALLDEIDAHTPAPSTDDTVRVVPIDSDEDTAPLAPVAFTWRETADQLRQRAAAIVRRWQSGKR